MNIDFTDNSDKVINEMEEAVERALEVIGLQAESHAKLELENDPRRVDTGLLRNSITHAVSGGNAAIQSYSSDDGKKSGVYSGNVPEESDDEKAVYIGTNVEYGIYVHEGTRKMTPNRFLKNAVTNNVDEYKKIVENELKNG